MTYFKKTKQNKTKQKQQTKTTTKKNIVYEIKDYKENCITLVKQLCDFKLNNEIVFSMLMLSFFANSFFNFVYVNTWYVIVNIV